MKEQFLVYIDCLVVQPLGTEVTRLGLEMTTLFVVNSNGRNVVVGVILATEKKAYE